MEEILRSYFERMEDINDSKVLAKCAAKFGIDEKEIQNFVQDEAAKPTKQDIDMECRTLAK